MPQHPEPALLLAIKPSLQLRALVLLIHGLALGASIANDLSLAFKSALIIGICLQGWITLKHLKNDPLTIKYTDTIGWQLLEDHDLIAIEILKSTVVTSFAIFLHYKKSSLPSLKMTQGKYSHLILNDALSDKDFRSLIVKLKITHIK